MRRLLQRFADLPHAETHDKSRRTVCLVRNTLIKETPEERVRQAALRSLHHDYGYPLWALQCEEPVARGTSNRTRADIIVRMAERPTVSVGEARSGTVPYSDWVKEATVAMGALSGTRIVSVSDEVPIRFDDVEHTLRFRGFRRREQRIFALFDANDELTEKGYPASLQFSLKAHNASPQEQYLIDLFGIEQTSEDHFLDFLDACDGDGSAMAAEVLAISDTRGYWVTPWDANGRGLLIELDTTKQSTGDALSSVNSDADPVAESPDDFDGLKSILVIECKAPQIGLDAGARLTPVRAGARNACPYFAALSGPLIEVAYQSWPEPVATGGVLADGTYDRAAVVDYHGLNNALDAASMRLAYCITTEERSSNCMQGQREFAGAAPGAERRVALCACGHGAPPADWQLSARSDRFLMESDRDCNLERLHFSFASANK